MAYQKRSAAWRTKAYAFDPCVSGRRRVPVTFS
jgi:hypothetical protein